MYTCCTFAPNNTSHASNPDCYRGSAPGLVFDFYMATLNSMFHEVH